MSVVNRNYVWLVSNIFYANSITLYFSGYVLYLLCYLLHKHERKFLLFMLRPAETFYSYWSIGNNCRALRDITRCDGLLVMPAAEVYLQSRMRFRKWSCFLLALWTIFFAIFTVASAFPLDWLWYRDEVWFSSSQPHVKFGSFEPMALAV